MWTHANARCARVGVGARAGPSAARRVLAPASRGGPGADAARRRSASSSRLDRDPATRSTPADAPPPPPPAAARTRAVRSLSSAALAGAAALAVALAPSPPAWADDDPLIMAVVTIMLYTARAVLGCVVVRSFVHCVLQQLVVAGSFLYVICTRASLPLPAATAATTRRSWRCAPSPCRPRTPPNNGLQRLHPHRHRHPLLLLGVC